MTVLLRRLQWIGVVILALLACAAGASPSATDPWDDGQPQDAFLLRRLSDVVEGLRLTARSDPELAAILQQVRLRAPSASLVELFPNAYAVPGSASRYVLIESRFVNQIAGLSAAGAYLALAEIDGPNTGARAQICSQIAATEAEAQRSGHLPVFTVELDKFPEAVDPPTQRLLYKLMGSVTDETMVWFLLHEVGHHAKQHQRSPGESSSQSRLREAAADRWASQTATRLGFGLFGVHRYLVGRAAIDRCLERLGYSNDEASSTHPSWRTRAEAMRKEFDTQSSGAGYPRLLFIAARPVDMLLFIAQPGDDAATHMVQEYRNIPGASEWQGNFVTVYMRNQTGGRIELRVPDAQQAIGRLTHLQFDANGRPVGAPLQLVFVQLDPAIMDWMEVAPGLRMRDIRFDAKDSRLRMYMQAVGTPPEAAAAVLKAAAEYRRAKDAAQVAYVKGQISQADAAARFERATSVYDQALTRLLGAERRARITTMAESDPVMSSWAPGQDPAYYRKLEEDLLKKNFDRADK